MDPFRPSAQGILGYGFGMTAAAMNDMARESGLAPSQDRDPADPMDPLDLTLPGLGATDEDLADFFEKMRRAKQEALERSRESQGQRPVDPDKKQGQSGPLEVKAHGFYKDDQFVPVTSIRIFEVGNYRKRSSDTFNGSWYESEYTHRMDNARVGQYYRAVVTWADGSTQERDVHMSDSEGQSVDIWKY